MSAAPSAPLDLSEPRSLHVVGVGGPGMSAIAIVLAEMGHTVSGSDMRERTVLDRVRAAGVEVHVGHSRSLVHGRDAITWSTAWLLYTSDAADDLLCVDLGGCRIIKKKNQLLHSYTIDT